MHPQQARRRRRISRREAARLLFCASVAMTAGAASMARADASAAGAVSARVARPPLAGPPDFPSTPAGTTVAAWLAAFNSGDMARLRAFHAERATSDEAERRAVMDALVFQETRGLDIHAITHSEAHEIALLARTRLTEQWLTLDAAVAPEPPHALTRLGFRPAGPPPELAPQARPSEAEIRAEMEAYVGRLADADAFSGVVLVAREDEVVVERAYGLADRSAGRPIDVATKFNLGSMNKMFTAVAIAQLVQEGRLAFADPIARHLPDYPREVAERVTIHHLLTHTSGLGDYFGPEFFAGGKDRLRTLDAYFPLFVDKPLEFEPGSDWRYSNAGFVVLGAIVEAATGQSYFDALREQVYRPAGMLDTDAYERDEAVSNLAVGYTRLGPMMRPDLGPRRENTETLPIKGGPAGGGYSTAGDLLRFARALQDHRLLSPELTARVQEPMAGGFEPDMRYGYGFIVRRANGVAVTGHGGGAPGISSSLEMISERGYTAIVLTNYDLAARPVADRLRTLLTA